MLIVLASLLAHMGLSTVANICWKISAGSKNFIKFVAWQAGGHLTGFIGVLVYTYLLTQLPLGRAFPIIQGLSVLAVQVLAARLFFKESMHIQKWVGTGFIVLGIVLVSVSG